MLFQYTLLTSLLEYNNSKEYNNSSMNRLSNLLKTTSIQIQITK